MELLTIYDSRQSFYGKATTEKDGNTLKLYSYNTLVGTITHENNKTIYKHLGTYSQTTSRHQKEFFRQNGLTDEQIKELTKKGTLEV